MAGHAGRLLRSSQEIALAIDAGTMCSALLGRMGSNSQLCALAQLMLDLIIEPFVDCSFDRERLVWIWVHASRCGLTFDKDENSHFFAVLDRRIPNGGSSGSLEFDEELLSFWRLNTIYWVLWNISDKL